MTSIRALFVENDVWQVGICRKPGCRPLSGRIKHKGAWSTSCVPPPGELWPRFPIARAHPHPVVESLKGGLSGFEARTTAQGNAADGTAIHGTPATCPGRSSVPMRAG